jgi:hypothetical protein
MAEEFDRERMATAAERAYREVSTRDWQIFVDLIAVRKPKDVAGELGVKVPNFYVTKQQIHEKLKD